MQSAVTMPAETNREFATSWPIVLACAATAVFAETVRIHQACRRRGARSRASACGAIGVLMPHIQDNPVGPPCIAALLQELELLDRLPQRGD